MRKKIRNVAAVLCSMILVFLSVCGCGKKEKNTQPDAGGVQMGAADYQEVPASELFSGRDYEVGYDESSAVSIVCKGQTAECASDAVQISGAAVTIGKEGIYLLSGQLDGMIIVDADKKDKIQLVLSGITVSSASSAAVYVRQADKVFITTAADSENVLINGGSFIAIDENKIDAVIFSKDDLTLNGQGKLSVESPAGHGIVSKDDLKITSGSYAVTAASHGLCGKDSVRIAGGEFNITAGKHGIDADNDDDETLGSVYLLGGTYRFTVQKDGINASCNVQINGGSFEIAAKDDGIHADRTLAVTDGKITVSRSYEGLEGQYVYISGGEIDINATDDGINAAGGRDGSGTEGGFPGGGFDGAPEDFPGDGFGKVSGDIAEGNRNGGDPRRGDKNFPQGGRGGFGGFGESNGSMEISGGTITIRASGDALDANGSLSVTGGTIMISGPDSGDTSILDYDISGSISGGSFFGTGASFMTQNFDASSAQGVIMVLTGRQAAGTTVTLTDADGKVILSHQADQAFSCVIVSCDAIKVGSTYTITAGSYTETVTMDVLVHTPAGANGGPGGFGGRPGAGQERFPDRGGEKRPGQR